MVTQLRPSAAFELIGQVQVDAEISNYTQSGAAFD